MAGQRLGAEAGGYQGGGGSGRNRKELLAVYRELALWPQTSMVVFSILHNERELAFAMRLVKVSATRGANVLLARYVGA